MKSIKNQNLNWTSLKKTAKLEPKPDRSHPWSQFIFEFSIFSLLQKNKFGYSPN